MKESTQSKNKNKSNIYLGNDAIDKVVEGINMVADIEKITLGAAGRNVLIAKDLFPFHIVTNDGISIAEPCYSEDPLHQIGFNIVKEVNTMSDRRSGDGRTTTTLLLQQMINEGIKEVRKSKSKYSYMDVRNSLKELVPLINKEVDKQKKDIAIDDVHEVATIAGDNPQLGDVIREIYQHIGKNGIIEIDNSTTDSTYYVLKEGVRFEKAVLVSNSLANKDDKAVHTNPLVLVTKHRITTNSDIEPVLDIMKQNDENTLVIFCDDMDNSVASALIATHNLGEFNIAIIKAPTLWKDYIFEDFAKVTGSTIISDSNGLRFKDIKLEHLGTCSKITSDKFETTIMGIKDITSHIEKLTNRGDEDSMRRIAWLNTRAAILKIGAESESDLSYTLRKASDAINASRLALHDGVVAGGGLSLINIIDKLPNTIGGRILKKALKAPMEQIIFNATGKIQSLNKFGGKYGYNSKTGKRADLWKDKVLDPAIVVKNSIKNAIGVASIVLTMGGVITKRTKTEEEKMSEFMKSMRPF